MPVDDESKPAPDTRGDDEDIPRVYRLVMTRRHDDVDRRTFVRRALFGGAAIAGATAVSACEKATFKIETDEDGECLCHAVCSCDTESSEGRTMEARWAKDGTCTCHTVCTCDTVCNCESVDSSGSSSGGGGGGSSCYWYPN